MLDLRGRLCAGIDWEELESEKDIYETDIWSWAAEGEEERGTR